MSEQNSKIYGFDNFRLDVPNRTLLRDSTPVSLQAKAFDMLVVLIENGGQLTAKDELFSRVWPDQTVEESNLTVQVSAIRRALGDNKDDPHYIITVPGHGYRFAGTLLQLDGTIQKVEPIESTSSGNDLIVKIKRHRNSAAIALAALSIAVAAMVWLWYFPRFQKTEIHSIAILPFTNVGADPEAE